MKFRRAIVSRELFVKKQLSQIKVNIRSCSVKGRNIMAPNKEYLDNVMKLPAPLGSISVKSMFGGFRLFQESAMFALISGNDLFFKVDESNQSSYEEAGSKEYGPMPYYLVSKEVFQGGSKLLD